MKNQSTFYFMALLIFLSNCTTFRVVLCAESVRYPPNNDVEILKNFLKRPFKFIAQLETRGSVGQSLPKLLRNMREESKRIGANAIIPTKESREKVKQGIFYNPWLDGYQTISRGQGSILSGLSTAYKSNTKTYRSKYSQTYKRDYSFGIGMNFAPFFLSGFGGSAWFGLKKFRFNF